MNLKRVLSTVFPRYSRHLDLLNHNALLSQWIAEHPPARVFEFSHELYEYLNESILANAAIDFLEFGVFKGESLQHWTRFNTNPESRFVGFDSFEGLPEDWKMGTKTLVKGHFSTDGALPEIDDPRVSFVKGWFSQTLGPFLEDFEVRNRLLVHIDCDLYSSSLFCLTRLDPIMQPGTIVLFDDFSGPIDVFRSFRDYTRAYEREYTCLGTRHPYYKEMAFELGGRRAQ